MRMTINVKFYFSTF